MRSSPRPWPGITPESSLASAVTVRYGDANDLVASAAMHRRCGAETLSSRFHAPTSVVSDRMVRQLLSPPDGWSQLLVLGDHVLGLASAAAVSPHDAEVGLVVEDAWQGHGLGSLLVREVALEARRRGFERLVCLVSEEDDSVLRTVRRAGLPVEETRFDGIRELSAGLVANQERQAA